MNGEPTTEAPGFLATGLALLGVLPRGEDWLTLDDIQTTADAYQVPVANDEHAQRLMRSLRRFGYVRSRRVDDDTSVWQVTPAGADAAQPLTQPTESL